jgi:hypothetical protein
VYDTMFLSSSNSNILTLYVTADDGSFVNSGLLVDGDTVCLPCGALFLCVGVVRFNSLPSINIRPLLVTSS